MIVDFNMKFDQEKIDDMVLALLYLTSFEDHGQKRSWKNMDWDVMNRLFDKEYISDPKSKSKSIAFTETGFDRCKVLFDQYFAIPECLNKKRPLEVFK